MKLLRSFSGFIVDVVGDDDADKNVNVEMPTLLKSQSFCTEFTDCPVVFKFDILYTK